MTSPSGVRCKRTSVSRLVVKLHSLYICRLVRRTPYDCSHAVDGSVLIVVVREYIVSFGSVSVPRPLLGMGAPSVLCWFLRVILGMVETISFHGSINLWMNYILLVAMITSSGGMLVGLGLVLYNSILGSK